MLFRSETKTQENAFIAQNTYDITSQTSLISKQIVDDSEQKEFLGKNEIKETNFINLFNHSNTKKQLTNTKNISNISNSKHDEWENF